MESAFLLEILHFSSRRIAWLHIMLSMRYRLAVIITLPLKPCFFLFYILLVVSIPAHSGRYNRYTVNVLLLVLMPLNHGLQPAFHNLGIILGF